MKDLNKSQLILLAVLLSFVTSIATGITTVTLMQQAPASVTAPINRVVQQTIEKIQQVEGKTITQTVVVKEEDLIVDAIAKNKGAVFAVSKDGYDMNGNNAEISAGTGFVISPDGVIVADAMLVPGRGVYYVRNDSGKFMADFMSVSDVGFSFLKIGAPINGTDKLAFTVPATGDINSMKIGQKILIAGSDISSSIFNGLNAKGGIDLVVPQTGAGGLVLDLDGEALGIALSSNANSFASMGKINDTLKTSSATN